MGIFGSVFEFSAVFDGRHSRQDAGSLFRRASTAAALVHRSRIASTMRSGPPVPTAGFPEPEPPGFAENAHGPLFHFGSTTTGSQFRRVAAIRHFLCELEGCAVADQSHRGFLRWSLGASGKGEESGWNSSTKY
jgi:hypothetical protein